MLYNEKKKGVLNMNKKIFTSILALFVALSAFSPVMAADEEEVIEDIAVSEESDDILFAEESEETESVDVTPYTILKIGEKSIFSNSVSNEIDVAPYIVDGTVMVPLRAIFEALGAVISWDADTRTIFAVKGNAVVVMQVGQDVMFVNGDKVEIEYPSIIVDSRTMIPLSAVSAAFECNVSYDAETGSITLE